MMFTCRHCGHKGDDVLEHGYERGPDVLEQDYQYVGGSGLVDVGPICRDLTACWHRWDDQHGFTEKEKEETETWAQ